MTAIGLEGQIPDGTRSVSLFLVNRRPPAADRADRAYAFQPVLEVSCEQAFVPRPDLRGAQADGWDEQVADLHYADTPEFATGHGVAADWDLVGEGCPTLRTCWIPRAQVEKTVPVQIGGVELGMLALGALADGEAAPACSGAARQPLPRVDRGRARRRWRTLPPRRRETAEQLLSGCRAGGRDGSSGGSACSSAAATRSTRSGSPTAPSRAHFRSG